MQARGIFYALETTSCLWDELYKKQEFLITELSRLCGFDLISLSKGETGKWNRLPKRE